MGGYGEGFKQREGQKERMTRKKRESGSERCEGEKAKIEMKQMERSRTRVELSVALYCRVGEFTVNR